MSAALTFGSLGDIIALCGLAVELSRALGSARGSAKEYQALRKDLDQFVQVLMQVIATYEQFERSAWLDSLAHVSRSVVDECGTLVGDVLQKFRDRYDCSLEPGGSGSRARDAVKKLEFSVRERETVRVLQETLRTAVGRLGMLASCAALRSARVDNTTLVLRIEEVGRQAAKHQDLENLTQAVSQLRLQHDSASRQAAKHEDLENLTQAVSQLKLEHDTASCQAATHVDIEGLIQAVARMELQHETASQYQFQQGSRIEAGLHQQHSDSMTILSSITGVAPGMSMVSEQLTSLGQAVANTQILITNQWLLRSLNEQLILFEDPFGCVDSLPLSWISSWEGLQTMIELRFKKSTGYDMVVQKHYLLEDDSNGWPIDQGQPFQDAFRSRTKVNMVMVFEGERRRALVESLPCPRCYRPAKVLDDGENFICANKTCGFSLNHQTQRANQTTLMDFGEANTQAIKEWIGCHHDILDLSHLSRVTGV
ncbi:hypothetical protein GE09DRAFT_317495 [Coniochaeta sp. 2T2.1]|nr:hypothetical protein GE09DRAFT_317495 [Coniochaeta sp. 2T2.1]